MVFEVKNLAVARERWVGGPQDCSHSQFFSQNAQDCSHSQNFRVYQSAGVRDSITSSLKTRQNPYKQSLFGELMGISVNCPYAIQYI